MNFGIIKDNIVMRDIIQLYEAKWYYPDGVGRNKKLPYLCAKILKVNIYIITMRTRQGRVREHERVSQI